jgi:hypothetical protein
MKIVTAPGQLSCTALAPTVSSSSTQLRPAAKMRSISERSVP